MSQIIEGVPERFTREQYASLFRAVGIAPEQVQSLEFRTDGVYAVVFALDGTGARTVDQTEGRYNTHRIYIPVQGDRSDFTPLCDARMSLPGEVGR